MSNKYDRLYAALVVPFKPGTEDIDEAAWRSFLRCYAQPKFLNAGGAVIANPEAGEAFCTTEAEKCRIAEIALEELGDKCPVFSGVIQPTTAATVREAKALKKVGVHGLFVIPPMGAMDITHAWMTELYPEVWIDMVKAIEDAVDLPAIAHPLTGHHPVFGLGFPLSSMLRMLDAVPQMIGWKMIYSDVGFKIIAKGLRDYKRHVGIFPAGSFFEPLVAGHFDGTVSGSWNYAMEPLVDMIEAARAKDWVKAREINTRITPLLGYVSGGPTEQRLHSAYKAAAWLRGLIPDPFLRLPMRKLREDEVHRLRDELVRAGFEVMSEEAVRKVYPSY